MIMAVITLLSMEYVFFFVMRIIEFVVAVTGGVVYFMNCREHRYTDCTICMALAPDCVYYLQPLHFERTSGVCVHAVVHVCTCIHACMCVCVHVYVRMYMYMHLSMYTVCPCMHAWVCVCGNMYVNV